MSYAAGIYFKKELKRSGTIEYSETWASENKDGKREDL